MLVKITSGKTGSIDFIETSRIQLTTNSTIHYNDLNDSKQSIELDSLDTVVIINGSSEVSVRNKIYPNIDNFSC